MTAYKLAGIAVQRLEALALNAAPARAYWSRSPDAFARRHPLVWRVAPAGDGLPAALIATRVGLGSVSVAIEPETLQRRGWHYLADVAYEMTKALS